MSNCESTREVAEAEYRKASVCPISRWFDRASVVARPIIPVVSQWFQPRGVATAYQAIPMDEFCVEQVRSAVEAGANGMALWDERGPFPKDGYGSSSPEWSECTVCPRVARINPCSLYLAGASA